ncbi:Ig-like and fibronectin type-III domain-containing protein C25G4.10 [Toxocara canis]|uniref:Ig-like and fibronectin type-III domain-containing protein C25G4.10 n=1 Tax=Toxocara canis TaxID=6265 RepID=A0A0B2V3J3_TOXCA|nr:Ig-like and fibronectin type-III domain-containing protein C25G4.10 [Toxocara canis]
MKVNVTANSIRFDDLEPGVNFSARAISFNKFGSSPPSFNISFETLPENEVDDKPKPPTKLHVAWNYGRRVNVTWEWIAERNNGEPIKETPTFSLYYVSTGDSSTWTSVKTQEKWYVMENLTLDTLYEVYVYASDGRTNSRSSSVITILAAPDEFSLPEPVISIDPWYANQTYIRGQQIGIKCIVESRKPLNVDLEVGNVMVHSDPPKMTVETSVTVDERMSPISCTAMDTDGRQNRAQMHLHVQFGPEVSIPEERVSAFDDLSAEIRCVVFAYPEPKVEWTYRKSVNSVAAQKLLEDIVTTKEIAVNKYEYTLSIKNATGRDGIYTCHASSGIIEASKDVELNVAKAAFPLTPRFVLQCCSDANISDKCLLVCSVSPQTNEDCSQYSKELIGCASDGRDHRACCVRAHIPSDCLGLCNGGKVPNEALCSRYAARAVACMIRGHERAPSPPGPIHYENLTPDSVKIHWSETNPDSYKVYAVYYRPEDSDDDYKVIKTSENELVLNGLDSNTNYDLALVSANALGHSPFVEAKILNKYHGVSGGKLGALLAALLVLFVAVGVVGAMMYMTRTNTLPIIMRKLHRSEPLSDRDPTVAFENPGYGTEVQIRGLGRSDNNGTLSAEWQNAELEVADATVTPEANNGMRYAKLSSS